MYLDSTHEIKGGLSYNDFQNGAWLQSYSLLKDNIFIF